MRCGKLLGWPLSNSTVDRITRPDGRNAAKVLNTTRTTTEWRVRDSEVELNRSAAIHLLREQSFRPPCPAGCADPECRRTGIPRAYRPGRPSTAISLPEIAFGWDSKTRR